LLHPRSTVRVQKFNNSAKCNTIHVAPTSLHQFSVSAISITHASHFPSQSSHFLLIIYRTSYTGRRTFLISGSPKNIGGKMPPSIPNLDHVGVLLIGQFSPLCQLSSSYFSVVYRYHLHDVPLIVIIILVSLCIHHPPSFPTFPLCLFNNQPSRRRRPASFKVYFIFLYDILFLCFPSSILAADQTGTCRPSSPRVPASIFFFWSFLVLLVQKSPRHFNSFFFTCTL